MVDGSADGSADDGADDGASGESTAVGEWPVQPVDDHTLGLSCPSRDPAHLPDLQSGRQSGRRG